MSNPFQPATSTTPRLKALFYGPAGVGKSHLAIETACALAAAEGKRVAALNLEGGLDYLARKGFDFDMLSTKSFAETLRAIDFVLSAEGESLYGAVVIDPITIVHHILQETQQAIVERRAAKKGWDPAEQTIGFREWGKVKAETDRLASRLVNARAHVIITAREGAEYGKARNGEMEVIGYKPEAHKSMPYLFDVVCRLVRDRDGRKLIVEKDRDSLLGEAVVNPSPSDFAAYASATVGAWKQVMCSSEAAERNADQEEAPLTSQEVMDEIEDLASRLGPAAVTWLAEEREKLRLNADRAAKQVERLREKLDEKKKAA